MSATYKDTRGSIILAALIVTLITGGLVGLFLKTVTQEVENSYRARMGFQAVNLAEAGLEFAIYAMITDDWSGWTAGSKGYYKDSFPILSNYTGNLDSRSARVYVQPTWKKNLEIVPVAVAEGAISLKNGVVVRRQIRIEMQKGSSTPWKRGWGTGIFGDEKVTLSGATGNVEMVVDSYRSSDPDRGIDPTSGEPYPPGYDPSNIVTPDGDSMYVDQDNGSVATNSLVNEDLSVKHAKIYGKIATGGGEPYVGRHGKIFGTDSTTDNDSTRIAKDFYADVPPPEAPTLTSPLTDADVVGFTFGQEGLKSEYLLSGLNIQTDVYTVKGEVVMVVTGDIDIQGLGSIVIEENSSLELYFAGDVDIQGTGIANKDGYPKNLLMFGTGGITQTVSIGGGGELIGAVYAPEAVISLGGGSGNGRIYGAVMGRQVAIKGNYKFSYDEDLADLEDDDDDDGKFVPVVNDWAELTDSGVRINDWDALRQNGFSDIN